jgi:hypothetical protein
MRRDMGAAKNRMGPESGEEEETQQDKQEGVGKVAVARWMHSHHTHKRTIFLSVFRKNIEERGT